MISSAKYREYINLAQLSGFHHLADALFMFYKKDHPKDFTLCTDNRIHHNRAGIRLEAQTVSLWQPGHAISG